MGSSEVTGGLVWLVVVWLAGLRQSSSKFHVDDCSRIHLPLFLLGAWLAELASLSPLAGLGWALLVSQVNSLKRFAPEIVGSLCEAVFVPRANALVTD